MVNVYSRGFGRAVRCPRVLFLEYCFGVAGKVKWRTFMLSTLVTVGGGHALLSETRKRAAAEASNLDWLGGRVRASEGE